MAPTVTPLTIGIAGGTGSGKTTISNQIVQQVGRQNLVSLSEDAYYRNLEDLPLTQQAIYNFDHPDSIETDLLIEHLHRLRAYQPIELPVYDFVHHARTGQTIHIEPRPVILVEGILVLAEPQLRELFDVKIFVDTDADIRFIRRLQRDIAERGRTVDFVIQQYVTAVRPMHMEFVEPSKRYADIIIPEGGMNTVALDMVIARIESLLHKLEAESGPA
jgi:uridine kinase